MTDIGDVHDVQDIVSQNLECSAQDIGVQKGTKVTDVSVIVDRGSAGVEGNRTQAA